MVRFLGRQALPIMAGENIGNVMIPIAVTDRMIHGPEPDRQASKAHPASPDVKHW
jgi:hypothetical protein